MTKSKISRAHSSTRRRRKLRKEIRNAIEFILVTVIGAVVISAMVFGASFQEQDRLAIMAAEVSR